MEGVVLMTIYRRGWTVYGDSIEGIVCKISNASWYSKGKREYGHLASIGGGHLRPYQMESRSGTVSASHSIVLGPGE